MNKDKFAIVADIGGTFARFSRVDLHTLSLDKVEVYPCASFVSLEAALHHYQVDQGLTELDRVAIAIACPVMGDLVTMTNGPWQFSIRELQQQLNLSTLQVLNDFNAIALSILALNETALEQIGSGTVDKEKPRAVFGAGTGLGMAYLIPHQGSFIAYGAAGGHVNWGAETEQEWLIYQFIKKHTGHVSYERLLSGQGIENIYQALQSAISTSRGMDPAHKPRDVVSAKDIIHLALTNQCSIAKTTIEQFFRTLAIFAGDLALTFGAYGGIYIAGGIVPRLFPILDKVKFRSYFEEKGRFREYNVKIPTFVITAEQPGLLGAAVSLKQTL